MTTSCNFFRAASPERSSSLTWIVAVLLGLLITGCASSGATADEPAPERLESAALTEADIELTLREALARWDGVPHRWGGTTRRGVDCSGLLHVWFAGLFDTDLPRSTAEQVRVGNRIQRAELQAGDLVFFQTTRSGRHVGVYLSNGEFAHASASSGVTTSHLAEPYWNSRYWMSRRVLDSPPVHQAGTSSPGPESTPDHTAPRGW